MKVPVTLGDLRTLSIASDQFALATCISTIAHIGFDPFASFDNKNFAFERALMPDDVITKRDPATNRKLMNHPHRALKPAGILLITVPMGRGGAVLLKDSLG